MTKKAQIKLKFEEGDTRVLNKIYLWNQCAIDCRALVNKAVKSNLPAARLYEIDDIIQRTKHLNKVEEVKLVEEQFEKIKVWDVQIQALTTSYPLDLNVMK